MKVIFLDIDGVLNFKNSKEKIEIEKVKLLKRIIEKTGAAIVLSSDWRLWWEHKNNDFLNLESKLKGEGMKMISKTPFNPFTNRGGEIKQWIETWNGEKIEKFAILDDGNDMKPYMDKLVQTNPNYGLVKEDIIKAINIFNN